MPIYFTVSELLELRNEELITKLREVGVLKSCSICIGCGKMLREVKYSRSIDKMAFRCYKRECDYFEKYISIRENSIFSQYKKTIYIILKAMYYWFRNIQMKIPEEELDISVSLVKKIYKDCRMFAYRMFYSNDNLLGGPGVICQIDESMFKYRQKYHRGRLSSENRWVFGIVDTTTTLAKYYVQRVENRSKNVLIQIITQRIRRGSIIFSDEWKVYNTIKNEGFKHYTVNHRFNFINGFTGAHTQNVESLWNKLKRPIKAKIGTDNETLDEYLV